MTAQQALEQTRQEMRDLRAVASGLVAERDRARRWAVQCESLLAAAVVLLREQGTAPCLDCHWGEHDTVEMRPEPFHPDNHARGCRIAAVLQGAGADRGGGER